VKSGCVRNAINLKSQLGVRQQFKFSTTVRRLD